METEGKEHPRSHDEQAPIVWDAMNSMERDSLFATLFLRWTAMPCSGEVGEVFRGEHPGHMRCYRCGYEHWFDVFDHEERPIRYHQRVDLLLPLLADAFLKYEVCGQRDRDTPDTMRYEFRGWTPSGHVVASSDELSSACMIALLRGAGWRVTNGYEAKKRPVHSPKSVCSSDVSEQN